MVSDELEKKKAFFITPASVFISLVVQIPLRMEFRKMRMKQREKIEQRSESPPFPCYRTQLWVYDFKFWFSNFELISWKPCTILLFQTVSPGYVATELFSQAGEYSDQSKDAIGQLPHLQPHDISSAVMYALSLPQHVRVSWISQYVLSKKLVVSNRT